MKTPAEYFKMPIKGKIITKRTECTLTNMDSGESKPHIMESEEYEFISEENTHYVCNQWYKSHKYIPQLIPKEFVDKVEIY